MFFILVLLITVFSLAQFQYRSLQSVVSLALLQIINYNAESPVFFVPISIASATS
jgi:hypothetical protein